jgi:DNA-directed RNA polymerase I subunit RPA43
MSTSAIPSPGKEATKARSKDPHKTKKRKHVDEHPEPGTEKKKKQKKAPGDDHGSLPATNTSVKKPKKRHRSPPANTRQPTPPSPSQIDLANATPSVIGNNAHQTPMANHTTPHHSPSPSLLESTSPSPFHSVRLSLYLPLSAISLSPSTALASIQAEHLSPLLLTYYGPARGIILAFTDTVLSSTPPDPSSPPSPTRQQQKDSTPILARCADDYGVSYTWLTATFLVFRPAPGDTLSGWTNVASDTFIGLIVYNYFQAGVARPRIPRDWRWVGPGAGGGGGDGEARKRSKRKQIRIRSSSFEHEDGGAMDIDVDADHTTQTPAQEDQAGDEEYDGTGYFVGADGSRVTGTMQFRIVDADVVPGHDREKWSVQIEGTLLNSEDEAKLVGEERRQAERLNARGKTQVHRASTPSRDAAVMSGALGVGDRRRTVSLYQTPVPSSARK